MKVVRIPPDEGARPRRRRKRQTVSFLDLLPILAGIPVAWLPYRLALRLSPRSWVVTTETEDAAYFTYGPMTLGMVVLIGIAIALVGWKWRFDYIRFNYFVLSVGASLVLLGLPNAALEKVVVNQDELIMRQGWGLWISQWKFDQQSEYRTIQHYRPWGRRNHWSSKEFVDRDGNVTQIVSDSEANRLFSKAESKLIEQLRGRIEFKFSHKQDS